MTNARRTSLAIIMPISTAEHSTGQNAGGRVGHCASACAGRAAMTMQSEGPVHSAEQPADPKRNDRRRIGLGFDGVSKPLVESGSGIARGVCCLAVEVLGSARRLVEFP